MGKIKHTDASKCINCHLCTKHCSFLTKYGITIGDVDRLSELKYSVFYQQLLHDEEQQEHPVTDLIFDVVY